MRDLLGNKSYLKPLGAAIFGPAFHFLTSEMKTFAKAVFLICCNFANIFL